MGEGLGLRFQNSSLGLGLKLQNSSLGLGLKLQGLASLLLSTQLFIAESCP